jgi:hypothetical protein
MSKFKEQHKPENNANKKGAKIPFLLINNFPGSVDHHWPVKKISNVPDKFIPATLRFPGCIDTKKG